MYCLTWTLSITLCAVALACNHSQPLPLGWSRPGYLLLTAVNLGLTTTDVTEVEDVTAMTNSKELQSQTFILLLRGESD